MNIIEQTNTYSFSHVHLRFESFPGKINNSNPNEVGLQVVGRNTTGIGVHPVSPLPWGALGGWLAFLHLPKGLCERLAGRLGLQALPMPTSAFHPQAHSSSSQAHPDPTSCPPSPSCIAGCRSVAGRIPGPASPACPACPPLPLLGGRSVTSGGRGGCRAQPPTLSGHPRSTDKNPSFFLIVSALWWFPCPSCHFQAPIAKVA